MGCYFKLLFVIITIMYEGVHVAGECEAVVTALDTQEITWFSELYTREEKGEKSQNLF